MASKKIADPLEQALLSLVIIRSNMSWERHDAHQGRIDPPEAERGHATPIEPVQRAKC